MLFLSGLKGGRNFGSQVGRNRLAREWKNRVHEIQPIYITDISKAWREFGWKAEIDVDHGMKRFFYWM